MRRSYKLNDNVMGEIKNYLAEQEKEQQKLFESLEFIRPLLRSVVAKDIKSHPRLLFIYNEMLKLKDATDQHISRKNELLIPFFRELLAESEPGHLSNARVVNRFLEVFVIDNRKIREHMKAIDDAAGGYTTVETWPPVILNAFTHLKKLSEELNAFMGKENNLLKRVQQNKADIPTNLIT